MRSVSPRGSISGCRPFTEEHDKHAGYRQKALQRLMSVVTVIAVLIITTSCTQRPHEHHDDQTPVDGQASVTIYTCPMHPHVEQAAPGVCPICGMDLVVKGSGTLMLTATQERLANIAVRRADSAAIAHSTIVGARLAVDENRRSVISSRVAGRVERVLVKETGKMIRAGSPLYEIYSEPLLAQAQEYLLLREQHVRLGQQQPRYTQMLKGAEEKLLLYGLTRKEIVALTPETRRIDFSSPVSGTVSEVLITEGQYAEEGAPLFRIDDLSKLWLELEIFPHEVDTYTVGDPIIFTIPGRHPFPATIDYLTPVYKANTQVIIARAGIDNRDGLLIPGMQATVQRIQKNTTPSPTLRVPIDAVIRNGKTALMFVRHEAHSYMPRVVKTGKEDASFIEITDGITANDAIVVSGAYLLYSELVLHEGSDFMAHH